MPTPTRRSLLASVGASLALAGCVSDSKASDPDLSVSLENESDESRRVRVWVVRQSTGETVFDAQRTVSPEEDVTLYNLRQAHPDGVESFRICCEALDAASSNTSSRECVTVETDECHGSTVVRIQKDGSVTPTYSIC